MPHQELTVQELIDKIIKHCPPNCLDKVRVSDTLTGDNGPIINMRYRHTSKGMVLELITDGDLEKRRAS